MVSKPQNSNQKFFIVSLIIISSLFLILILTFKPFFPFIQIDSSHDHRFRTNLPTPRVMRNPRWFQLVQNNLKKRNVKIGFLNIPKGEREDYEARGPSIAGNIHVGLDSIPKNLTWNDLFPEWIDEDNKWHAPKCPEIPLGRPLGILIDVIVVKVPCGGWSEKRGLRDIFRLQVNLAAANLVVESGLRADRTVYVVFIGLCGPMQEIFRCDERVRRVGAYSVYKPDIKRLKQKLLMPVGSCRVAPPYAQTGQEAWRPKESPPDDIETLPPTFNANTAALPPAGARRLHNRRVAYVTILHSSEAYVCGAIALAQSIRQSGSTRDLVLLHDDSISNHSKDGLKSAGWDLRHIQRIRSPFSKKDSYNEWNYSKLRIWQITDYEKIVFIDADFIVLKNLDHLFYYPQLSAAGNDKDLFNSGIMVIEPSICMFEDLMLKSFKVESYNGGDQGFLNEVFVWWHRLPKSMNSMKFFDKDGDGKRDSDNNNDNNNNNGGKHGLPYDPGAIHYLGLKPWACYRDYDCNWDMKERRVFASDSMHERWWNVYDKMPEKLQKYCGLSHKTKARIEKWRKIARKDGSPDKHWEISVKDPRKKNLLVV